MSAALILALATALLLSVAVALKCPKLFRVVIIASTIMVTANPDIPLHLISAGLFVIYFAVRLVDGDVPRQKFLSWPIVLIGIFSVAIGIAYLNAVPNDVEPAWNSALRLILHLGVFGMLVLETATLSEWFFYLGTYITAVCAEALFGILTYFVPGLYGLMGAGFILEFGAPRLTGLHADPNFFAVLIVPAILYSLGSIPAAQSRKYRLYLVSCLAVLCIAVALTLSRTGFLSLAAGLLTWAIVGKRKKGAIIVALLLAGVMALSFAGLGLGSQVETRADVMESHSFLKRVNQWEFVSTSLTPSVLLLGGWGRVRVLNMATHETYLFLAEELGILGLAGYLASLLLSVVNCYRVCRSGAAPGRTLDLYATVAGSVVALFVAGFAIDLINERGTWVVLGLAAALCVANTNAQRTAAWLGSTRESLGAPSCDAANL